MKNWNRRLAEEIYKKGKSKVVRFEEVEGTLNDFEKEAKEVGLKVLERNGEWLFVKR